MRLAAHLLQIAQGLQLNSMSKRIQQHKEDNRNVVPQFIEQHSSSEPAQSHLTDQAHLRQRLLQVPVHRKPEIMQSFAGCPKKPARGIVKAACNQSEERDPLPA